MLKFLALTTKSLEEHNAKSHRELWQKAQKEGCIGLTLDLDAEIVADVDGDTKTFRAVFSTDSEDRHGERVFQNFDLKSFKKNPVYLNSHRYFSIEDIIGRVASVGVKDGKLQGNIEFATMNPMGKLAQEMAEGGFLNTSSIGFIPKEFDNEGNILKSELLEISAVSIPANPEALYEGEKAKEADPEPVPPVADPVPPVEKQEVVGETRNDRAAVARTIRTMSTQRRTYLAAAAREIAKFSEPGAQKRQVFRTVRELMKEAKADTGV